MISAARLKLLRSLQHKKYRDQHGLFLVEGDKMVRELTAKDQTPPLKVKEIYATSDWIMDHQAHIHATGIEVVETSRAEIHRISALVSPQPVLAVVAKPEFTFPVEELLHTPVLAFESIRDPGNLGTILRTADWFGLEHIVCTPDSADVYNPKVVQSTMGAIARVRVHYRDLNALLASPAMRQKAVYGTFLDGENIYETSLAPSPLILFGNESHGLSGALDRHIRLRLSIPSFSTTGKGSESLNVASAVAVVCSELKRRTYSK